MMRFITKIPKNPTIVEQGKHICVVGIFQKGWKKKKTFTLHVGANASAKILFLFLGSGDAAFPLDCFSVQSGSASRVKIAFRSALFGSASVKGSAVVHINKKSDGSDAVFSHHILLLSERAQGFTVPSLEIETADSTAKHAASVSTLDEESLFYLGTRGCDGDISRTLLIRGFLNADAGLIEKELTRKRLEHFIDSFLATQKIFAPTVSV